MYTVIFSGLDVIKAKTEDRALICLLGAILSYGFALRKLVLSGFDVAGKQVLRSMCEYIDTLMEAHPVVPGSSTYRGGGPNLKRAGFPVFGCLEPLVGMPVAVLRPFGPRRTVETPIALGACPSNREDERMCHSNPRCGKIASLHSQIGQ